METKPALCLDFDGTIRKSKSGKFIKDLKDIELLPGVESVIWEYREKGFLIFGITNQGGVAFGIKTSSDDAMEIDMTCNLFLRNPFHSVFSCPFHENGSVEPFNHRSLLRKPSIGMLVMAEQWAFKQGIIVDWDKSLFVGDRPEDEQCAKNAQVQFEWAHIFFSREEVK